MPALEPDKTVTTRTPSIDVDGSFKAGRHRFELVVVRADGKTSQPATVVVEVASTVLRRPV